MSERSSISIDKLSRSPKHRRPLLALLERTPEPFVIDELVAQGADRAAASQLVSEAAASLAAETNRVRADCTMAGVYLLVTGIIATVVVSFLLAGFEFALVFYGLMIAGCALIGNARRRPLSGYFAIVRERAYRSMTLADSGESPVSESRPSGLHQIEY